MVRTKQTARRYIAPRPNAIPLERRVAYMTCRSSFDIHREERFRAGVKRTKYLKSLANRSRLYVNKCRVIAMRKACMEYLGEQAESFEAVLNLVSNPPVSPSLSLSSGLPSSVELSSLSSSSSSSSSPVPADFTVVEDIDIKIEDIEMKTEDVEIKIEDVDIKIEDEDEVKSEHDYSYQFKYEVKSEDELKSEVKSEDEDKSEDMVEVPDVDILEEELIADAYTQTSPYLSMENQTPAQFTPQSQIFNGIWLPRDMFYPEDTNQQEFEAHSNSEYNYRLGVPPSEDSPYASEGPYQGSYYGSSDSDSDATVVIRRPFLG